MKGEKFFSGLTVMNESVGVNIEDANNDKVIHEAIIFDTLGGNMQALNEFYSHIGAFGSRDGILNESAAFDNKLNLLGQKGFAKTATILCVANESADADYDLYKKALLLMEAAMDNMTKKYESAADERLQRCTQAVSRNARVQDALNKVSK